MTKENTTKVLIADDESSLRTLLKAIIESNPRYLLDEAEDGLQTMEKVRSNKPDVLILDIMMPGLSGFEVCEKIKKDPDLRDITVLILTAKGQKTDRDWALSIGADYFLSKPFSPLELLDLLEKVSNPQEISS
jgi:CheY-like chemotaxis protein